MHSGCKHEGGKNTSTEGVSFTINGHPKTTLRTQLDVNGNKVVVGGRISFTVSSAVQETSGKPCLSYWGD